MSPRLRKGLMVATLLGLIAVIAVTPGLRGPPRATIQSAPLVVLDLRPTEVVAAVHGAFDQVRYANITISAQALVNLSYAASWSRNDTYGLEVRILRSAGTAFDLTVTVYDTAGNGFRWRGSLFVDRDLGGEFMSVTNIGDLRSSKVYPPATFRTLLAELLR